MENQEHLHLLWQGTNAWNQWRVLYPEVQVNLSEAKLGRAKLMNACLQGANLEQIQVRGANFSGADLCGIPWLIVIDLTMQPDVNLAGVRWDRPPG